MAPMMAPPVMKEKPKEKEMEKEPAKETSAPATIQVNLPADAKLSIDGAATTSTSAQRSFVSPTLEPGKDYYYTLKAEVVRDGKTLVATQRIQVRPGQTTPVNLNDFQTTQVASR